MCTNHVMKGLYNYMPYFVSFVTMSSNLFQDRTFKFRHDKGSNFRNTTGNSVKDI